MSWLSRMFSRPIRPRQSLAGEQSPSVTAADARSAPSYYVSGLSYDEKGEYDRAIVDYTKAIELDPTYAPAYNNRGLLYRDKGEYDRAIADLTNAIEINPQRANAYSNRGIAYHGKGEYDRAIADFTRAIEINPDFQESKVALQSLAREQSPSAKAADARSAASYFESGVAHTATGEYDQAITDFTGDDRIETRPRE